MRDVGSHKIEIKASKCSVGLCQEDANSVMLCER